ncbi:MAG TPA: carboxypeptidase regulatory-like domain-containing protein [Bryobacteraceae bacterium]|nr:carboxypeptidase regulatory-like domain-containing protein [Bryobacteraceae bacterium]
MNRRLLPTILATPLAIAQSPQPAEPVTNASISGIVNDASTGRPLANYLVATRVRPQKDKNIKARDVESTTDDQGRYHLNDLPPGDYHIQARSQKSFRSSLSKVVKVAGHDIEHIDFHFILNGSISGKIVDENGEPVPGLSVELIGREYFLGALRYHFEGFGSTNDRGEYTITEVPPGRASFLLAESRPRRLLAHSEVPLNPKLRRRIPMRTWYPNSPSRDGAQAITLRGGEHRESLDMQIRKSPSYCIDGTLEGAAGPAALTFLIEALQPSSGVYANGGTFIGPLNGTTGRDGKFRLCDFFPGTFRFGFYGESANGQTVAPTNYGVEDFTIVDRDLHNLKFTSIPGTKLEGEVAWDGPPPDRQTDTQFMLYLQPMFRTPFGGETLDARTEVPGKFSFEALFADAYNAQPRRIPTGTYVKDITYGGRSALYEPLQVGSAVGGGIHVIVGVDGGTISAQVTDKDSNPLADQHVLIVPYDATSEPIFAATMTTGITDQQGQFKSQTLRPGKYLIAATSDALDTTPETIARLMQSRNHFQELDLPPKGAPQVTIQPTQFP